MEDKDKNGIAKKKRPNEQKEENKYKEGSAKEGVVDLNEITFKNAQAKKLLDAKKRKERDAANQSSKNESTRKSKFLSFGGSNLGSSRMKLHRKTNNRIKLYKKKNNRSK